MAVSTLFREEAEANTKDGYKCLRKPKYDCVLEALSTVGQFFQVIFFLITYNVINLKFTWIESSYPTMSRKCISYKLLSWVIGQLSFLDCILIWSFGIWRYEFHFMEMFNLNTIWHVTLSNYWFESPMAWILNPNWQCDIFSLIVLKWRFPKFHIQILGLTT